MDQVLHLEKSLTFISFILIQSYQKQTEINVSSNVLQTSFVEDVEESDGDEYSNEEEVVPDEDESGSERERGLRKNYKEHFLF